MKCDICHQNEATIHLTQILDGKMLKVDLCDACAKAKGVQETGLGFSLSELVGGLGVADETRAESPGAVCPICGMSQADFKKTGRLGCAACWETFEAGLNSLLKAMHKGDHHVGKVPGKAAHTLVIQHQIKGLSAQLAAAVRAEKYETAAGLRDEIRQLESQLKMSVGKK